MTPSPLGLPFDLFDSQGAVLLLADVVATHQRKGETLVLTDATPKVVGGSGPSAGEDVMGLVSGLLPEARLSVLGSRDGTVIADPRTIAEVVSDCAGVGCLVTVGSGTMTDIGKVASHKTGTPLVAVQTAASVNGFADDLSVVLQEGAKRTVASTYPAALVIDHGILAGAPVELGRAGLGECVGGLVAPADWQLALIVGADPTFSSEIVSMYHSSVEGLMGIAGGIGLRHEQSLAEMARLLTLAGLAMGKAGRTAPLSGTEHAVSHLLDMAAPEHHGLHGSQVGVAAVVAACLWEVALDRLDLEQLTVIPEDATIADSLGAALTRLDPKTIDECWSDYRGKPAHWRSAPPSAAVLSSLAERTSTWLGDPAGMAAVLTKAGAPTRFSELDPPVDSATARWAVANAHLLRSRFTVLDLVVFTGGNLGQVVDDALERAQEVGGGF